MYTCIFIHTKGHNHKLAHPDSSTKHEHQESTQVLGLDREIREENMNKGQIDKCGDSSLKLETSDLPNKNTVGGCWKLLIFL